MYGREVGGSSGTMEAASISHTDRKCLCASRTEVYPVRGYELGELRLSGCLYFTGSLPYVVSLRPLMYFIFFNAGVVIILVFVVYISYFITFVVISAMNWVSAVRCTR